LPGKEAKEDYEPPIVVNLPDQNERGKIGLRGKREAP